MTAVAIFSPRPKPRTDGGSDDSPRPPCIAGPLDLAGARGVSRRVQLTLLQRGVIQRMREAGYPQLADGAHKAWIVGERCNLPVHSLHPQLLADYEKANAEAGSTAED